jgi:putative copper resistance protein D
LPLLIVVIALLIQWSRQDERSARRADRRADSDGDAELTAYNEMLRRLAVGGSPLVADERISKNGPGHTIESEAAADAAPEGGRGAGR